jgi:hypothetical protein
VSTWVREFREITRQYVIDSQEMELSWSSQLQRVLIEPLNIGIP